MCSRIRQHIGQRIYESLFKLDSNLSLQYTPCLFQKLLKVEPSYTTKETKLRIRVNGIDNFLANDYISHVQSIEPDNIVKEVSGVHFDLEQYLEFKIDTNVFIRDVLENCTVPHTNDNPQNIVVDFSSVNIAKPFHMGHLRSTMIGNFISNLNLYLKNRVTRINYLGDWGTQFGILQIGLDRLGYTPENIVHDPLRKLYEAYVYANGLGNDDPNILNEAKQVFIKLEEGKGDMKAWKYYLDVTKKELATTYERLGVTFDEYHSESLYSTSNIQPIINELKAKNVIRSGEDGAWSAKVNDRDIVILKNDGTSLYLTRDIAAAVDRFKKYNFDKMYYVVGNSQFDHFNALKNILEQMGYPWHDRLHHVKFGVVHGMSSRQGTAVFLKDILDDAKELMKERQTNSKTTKAPITSSEITDILGVSCVVVNDLKLRRGANYNFDSERILQVGSKSGITLQYTHCRIKSLQNNCNFAPATEIIPDLLNEMETIQLITHLGCFQDILLLSNKQLQSSILVNYLFELCVFINRGLNTLKVKHAPEDIGRQRLLLFTTSSKVLYIGMKILGLKPLDQM